VFSSFSNAPSGGLRYVPGMARSADEPGVEVRHEDSSPRAGRTPTCSEPRKDLVSGSDCGWKPGGRSLNRGLDVLGLCSRSGSSGSVGVLRDRKGTGPARPVDIRGGGGEGGDGRGTADHDGRGLRSGSSRGEVTGGYATETAGRMAPLWGPGGPLGWMGAFRGSDRSLGAHGNPSARIYGVDGERPPHGRTRRGRRVALWR